MHRLLLTALLLLAFPASAAAALGETPPVPIGGVRSECVQTTGPSGAVLTATKSGPRLFLATREGFKAAPTPDFSRAEDSECTSASIAASGAGVIACCQYAFRPAAALREPGGAWGDPVELTDDDGGEVQRIGTAVSERGDAIVLFLRARGHELRLSAVRRAPGAAFGAPELVIPPVPVPSDPSGPTFQSFQAAMTADGETVLLYELPEGEHSGARRNTVDVMVVTAPAGGRFGTSQKLAAMPRLSHSSLAVAPDGHALISLTDATSIRVAARAPGHAFGAPVRVAALEDPVGATTRVALDVAGRAVVAWSGIAFGGVTAITRVPSGAFSTPVSLAPAVRRLPVSVALVEGGGLDYPIPAGGWYFGGAQVSAGLDAGGAWVSWNAPRTTDGRRYTAAAVASLPFDGSPATTQTVGGEIADARMPSRITLTDGMPALMWLDDTSRLRLATDGAQAAITPLPDVQIGRPLKTALTSKDKLRLPIRCSGPCEVRGQVLGASDGEGRLTLDQGGKGTLVIESDLDAIAPQRAGRVRVGMTYGPAGGARVATRTLTLRLSQKPPRAVGKPEPKIQHVRAVRHGKQITVTWTADAPLDSFFDVFGTATRSRFDLPLVRTVITDNRRRTRFSITLSAAGVHYVTVIGWGSSSPPLVARVRG